MNISVIICTYNRSERLKNTLKSIKEMAVPQELSWELIVVDNNSKDNTREIIDDFIKTSGLSCNYVLEGNQGHSHARNRGVKEAKGEIIAFTDDDVLVDKYWLNNIVKAFKANNAACVGGKILPIWERPCPKWLKQELFGDIALLDLGNEYIRLPEPNLWGANFAVKSFMFQEHGYFKTTLGRIPGKLYSNEETDFIRTLIKEGEKVFYCPAIIVHHCIPTDRMKKSYFRKRRYDQGELRGIQIGCYSYRNIMGIPLYAIKQIVIGIVKYFLYKVTRQKKAFCEQLILINNIGFIAGRIKYRIMKHRERKHVEVI